MGALKVWTGSQWTEAGGGLRDVPAGVVGAIASRNAAVQAVGASYTKLTLDASSWDSDGYFDDANDRMTVPAGMGGPHLLLGNTFVASGTSSTLYFLIYKNGTAWRQQRSVGTSGDWPFQLAYVDPDAVPGDYYELYAYASGGSRNWGSATIDGEETRLSIYKLGSGNVGDTIGAKVYNDGVVANSAVIPFDAELWDTDGFHDNSTNNSRVTIPAGLAGKYLVQFTSWVSATTTRPEIYVNGSIAPGRGSFGGNSGTANYIGAVGVYDLAAGDYVEIFHNGSGTVGDAGTQGDWAVLSVTLLATTGADPGRVRTGTAFPTPGAAWTDRFVRTDLDGIEFTHDGTRWVSTEMFKWVCGSSALTVDTFISRACVHSTLDVFIESMESTVFTTTALSPTNSAGVVLSKVDTANSTTEVARETYESGGSSAWTSASTAVGASVDTSAYPVQLRIDYDETGTVSSLAVEVAVYYRLIAT